MDRECKKHGMTDHAIRKSGGFRCRKCAVDSVNKRRRIVKQKAIDYKGGKCVKCGYAKYNGSLEFHHTDSSKKDFTISNKGHSKAWATIEAELDKCMLVCSNCHKEIHGGFLTTK